MGGDECWRRGRAALRKSGLTQIFGRSALSNFPLKSSPRVPYPRDHLPWPRTPFLTPCSHAQGEAWVRDHQHASSNRDRQVSVSPPPSLLLLPPLLQMPAPSGGGPAQRPSIRQAMLDAAAAAAANPRAGSGPRDGDAPDDSATGGGVLRLSNRGLKVFPTEAVLSGGAVVDKWWLVDAVRSIDVSFNQIPSLPPSVLPALEEALQVLKLQGNALTHLPDTLADLRALKHLDVSRNALTHLPSVLPPSLVLLNAGSNPPAPRAPHARRQRPPRPPAEPRPVRPGAPRAGRLREREARGASRVARSVRPPPLAAGGPVPPRPPPRRPPAPRSPRLLRRPPEPAHRRAAALAGRGGPL
jgi:hypothetical protein